MSEKYIDLASRISNESGAYHLRDTIIEGVLEWLDNHPDQVPGRTITESRFNALSDQYHVRLYSFQHMVDELGITVVPNPEPTNAEQLRADLEDIWDGNNSLNSVVQWLNDNGWVKAPGGDDD